MAFTLPSILRRKKKTEEISQQPFDKKNEVKKLCIFMTIVNFGQSNAITHIFSSYNCSAQYVMLGNGTATRQVMDLLGFEDNRKEVIISIIPEDIAEDIKKELEAYFAMNKKNRGIGFSIPMTSMIGVKLYHFLTNTL